MRLSASYAMLNAFLLSLTSSYFFPKGTVVHCRQIMCAKQCRFHKHIDIAGTHWVWEIVSMLLKGSAEYDKSIKEQNMIDFHFPEEFDNLKSPRVLNSHFTWRHLPEEIREKKCRIIFLQRNPKDTVVSYYHHMKNLGIYGIKGDCNDFIDLFMKGRGTGIQ